MRRSDEDPIVFATLTDEDLAELERIKADASTFAPGALGERNGNARRERYGERDSGRPVVLWTSTPTSIKAAQERAGDSQTLTDLTEHIERTDYELRERQDKERGL